MNKVSRRSLAKYAADQLLVGVPAKKVAKQLAAVLLESGDADKTELLVGDIASELENRGELAVTKVTSTSALTNELRGQIKTRVKMAVKVREVVLEENVDASVIGGIRIETAAKVWDSTTVRKLADLREAF